MNVPGSFELTFGASVLGETTDLMPLLLGSVVKGETKHFDFVCQGVSNGITQLNITLDIPVILVYLQTTPYNKQLTDLVENLVIKELNAIAAIKMASINQILRAE